MANGLAKSVPREEDFVATLVSLGIQNLGHRWIPLLSAKGIAMRLSGVFCHGHPQVKFGSSKVELADLLVVHQHTSAAGSTSMRALLVQAKMSDDATHKLPSGDEQLLLFSTWPPFEFSSGGLRPGIRNLKETGKGSRYALVLNDHAFPEDITWADQCPWGESLAVQQLAVSRSFARTLGSLLLGWDGRPVYEHSKSDDWSTTIKELLEVTGKRTYRRTNIGISGSPRITEVGSPGVMRYSESHHAMVNLVAGKQPRVTERFFASVMDVSGADPNTPDPEPNQNREGGISSLIIETNATQQ